MFEYNIQEVKKEKIKYVEYMGPLAEYCDELKSGLTIRFTT